MFSYGVVLWELLTLEQPWFNDHERPGLCSRIMPEVHGGNQLFVIRQVPLGVRLPLPSAQDVEPPWPTCPRCALTFALPPRLPGIFLRHAIIALHQSTSAVSLACKWSHVVSDALTWQPETWFLP